MNGMVRGGRVGVWCNIFRVGVALCLIAFSKLSWASNLAFSDITNGYSNCNWRDRGDGWSDISVTVSFKKGRGSVNPFYFSGRAILISSYDKNGVVGPSDSIVERGKLSIDGYQSSVTRTDPAYTLYTGGFIWYTEAPFNAVFSLRIENSKVADWPAVAVRAANLTEGTTMVYGEIAGAAYIARGDSQTTCRVITDPGIPPPMPIAMTMSAPDWDLGELQEGDSTKTFPNSSEQLCFSYSGASASGKKFIINAGSANGISGNRYRLKNTKDSTQIVPYSITLDSGISTLTLPNSVNKAISLNSGGRTCFVPTFATSVESTLKGGDYSDVLTFTVVTKS